MNFLNIKYFMVIAEEKNISAAARKLYVSQQSLSEHLKKLEAELGVPLFKRGGSSLSLTVAGECFFEGAREMLKVHERMLANINAVTIHRRSKITVGVPTYSDPPFLADLLVRFTTNHPQYDVSVVKRLHSDISHNMRGADLYISVCPVPEELEAVPIIDSDPYCAVFREDLAAKIYGDSWPDLEKELTETQNLALLKEMPFILLTDRHSQLANDLDLIFKEYEFTPKIGFLSENGSLNADMCLRGTGCILMPQDSCIRYFSSRCGSWPSELRRYPIKVDSFRPYLAICYEKGKHLHDAEICFLNEARAFLANSI